MSEKHYREMDRLIGCILELEGQLGRLNASDCEQMTRYEEELAVAQDALLQAQKRILELEDQLVDAKLELRLQDVSLQET